MTKSTIEYEIRQITKKIRWIEANDLYEMYDVKYLEDRLRELKAELEVFKI